MARGSSRFSEIKIFRQVPFSLVTCYITRHHNDKMQYNKTILMILFTCIVFFSNNYHLKLSLKNNQQSHSADSLNTTTTKQTACVKSWMHLNPISASVCPVKVSGYPVNSDAIWVVDLCRYQHHGVTAIDVGSSDGPNLIICPIDITLNWVIVYSYGMANVVNLQVWGDKDEMLDFNHNKIGLISLCMCVSTCSTMSVKSGRSREILLRSVRRASNKTCSAPEKAKKHLLIICRLLGVLIWSPRVNLVYTNMALCIFFSVC